MLSTESCRPDRQTTYIREPRAYMATNEILANIEILILNSTGRLIEF